MFCIISIRSKILCKKRCVRGMCPFVRDARIREMPVPERCLHALESHAFISEISVLERCTKGFSVVQSCLYQRDFCIGAMSVLESVHIRLSVL